MRTRTSAAVALAALIGLVGCSGHSAGSPVRRAQIHSPSPELVAKERCAGATAVALDTVVSALGNNDEADANALENSFIFKYGTESPEYQVFIRELPKYTQDVLQRGHETAQQTAFTDIQSLCAEATQPATLNSPPSPPSSLSNSSPTAEEGVGDAQFWSAKPCDSLRDPHGRLSPALLATTFYAEWRYGRTSAAENCAPVAVVERLFSRADPTMKFAGCRSTNRRTPTGFFLTVCTFSMGSAIGLVIHEGCGASVGCSIESAVAHTGPARLRFPIGGAVAIRVNPRGRATTLGNADHADLVELICYVHGVYVAPPPALASAGGNDLWDKVKSRFGVGWVPDSYVNSHTSGSAARPC
jgi:hypothetical protein